MSLSLKVMTPDTDTSLVSDGQLLETEFKVSLGDGYERSAHSCLKVFQCLKVMSAQCFLHFWEGKIVTWTQVWTVGGVVPELHVNRLKVGHGFVGLVGSSVILEQDEVAVMPQGRPLLVQCLSHSTQRLDVLL